MTNADRNLDSIEKANNILKEGLDFGPESKKYVALTSILMILTDISISLANIADYFTEKDNKKES